jgi:8-amino-7-oxononanoate synthase
MDVRRQAVILGSELRDCLVNFAQSFKYTAGFHCVPFILTDINIWKRTTNHRQIRENIIHFNQEKNMFGLKQLFVHSKSTTISHHSG